MPIFGKKSKCGPEILPKNRNFTRKTKFYPKIEILPKNRNFTQKIKMFAKLRGLNSELCSYKRKQGGIVGILK